MRKLIGHETLQQLRLNNIENKLLEHDQKFDKLFITLEQNELPQKGLFFDRQVFDAYQFVTGLLKILNLLDLPKLYPDPYLCKVLKHRYLSEKLPLHFLILPFTLLKYLILNPLSLYL